MKKLVSLALAAVMMMSVAGCASGNSCRKDNDCRGYNRSCN